MSYDISVMWPGWVSEEWNYTYNVAPMFVVAFGDPNGIRAINGKTCDEAIGWLDAAIDIMEADPDMFKDMNPPNGWGDYDGALRLLRDMRASCKAHPSGKVEVV